MGKTTKKVSSHAFNLTISWWKELLCYWKQILQIISDNLIRMLNAETHFTHLPFESLVLYLSCYLSSFLLVQLFIWLFAHLCTHLVILPVIHLVIYWVICLVIHLDICPFSLQLPAIQFLIQFFICFCPHLKNRTYISYKISSIVKWTYNITSIFYRVQKHHHGDATKIKKKIVY